MNTKPFTIALLILPAFFAAGCIAPNEPGATAPPEHPEPDISPEIDRMELAAPMPTATPNHNTINETDEPYTYCDDRLPAATLYARGCYGSGGSGSSGSAGCPPCDSCCPPCPPIPELPTSAALCIGIVGIFIARRWIQKL